jgi:hypothetical protein
MSDDETESWIALAAKTRDVVAFLRFRERSAPAGGRRDLQPAGAFTSAEASADGREEADTRLGGSAPQHRETVTSR